MLMIGGFEKETYRNPIVGRYELAEGLSGWVGGFSVRIVGLESCSKEAGCMLAGRVGFEPTICGSAGRRLGPGSTTGPGGGVFVSPYNGYNWKPNLTREIFPTSRMPTISYVE